MPAASPANPRLGADSRCNPSIFRSPQTRADAARDQRAAGHEPKLSHRKTLAKSSPAAHPATQRSVSRQRKKREHTDGIEEGKKTRASVVVAGIDDPGRHR